MPTMTTQHSVEKVLYLDFDGVLHDADIYWYSSTDIVMNTPGRVLFEWMPILEQLMAPYPDVAIVLSTSWVRADSLAFAKEQLSTALSERVIGATFHKGLMRREIFARLPRGVQITEDVSRRGVKSWFAIDDDYVGWPEWCKDKLVKTESHVGLSDPAVQHAIQVMLQQL